MGCGELACSGSYSRADLDRRGGLSQHLLDSRSASAQVEERVNK